MYESGFNIRKVVDLEDLGSRVGTVLGKSTIFKILTPWTMKSKWELTHGNTVSIEILAEQKLSTSAVEAFLAELGVARK